MTLSAAFSRLASSPERSWAVARARIALVVVVLYAGASTARWLHRGLDRPAGSAPDEISAYEDRFDGIRSVLPARGVVGYLGQTESAGTTPREANAAALLHFRHYLLAQYALAPLLLVQGTDPELVVGNFDAPPDPTTPEGFRVVQDFGNGVVLFRRARP